MSKHSPGPWQWGRTEYSSDDIRVCLTDCNEFVVGGYAWREIEGHALPDNADTRLIAAAPELLAMLKACTTTPFDEITALIARIEGDE